MSVIIDHCCIPCVYGCLTNKTLITYNRFFTAIRDSIAPDWFPARIMSDFEVYLTIFLQKHKFHLQAGALSAVRSISQYDIKWLFVSFW